MTKSSPVSIDLGSMTFHYFRKVFLPDLLCQKCRLGQHRSPVVRQGDSWCVVQGNSFRLFAPYFYVLFTELIMFEFAYIAPLLLPCTGFQSSYFLIQIEPKILCWIRVFFELGAYFKVSHISMGIRFTYFPMDCNPTKPEEGRKGR